MNNNALIVGSGLTAPEVNKWNTAGWTIVVINNAWMATEKWDILIHSVDFSNLPMKTKANQRIVNGRRYHREVIDRIGGIRRVGATMFFCASHWVAHMLNPRTVGYIGCDMHYPEGRNTFYGVGTADPLRNGEKWLQPFFDIWLEYARSEGIELVNFSSGPTRLPLPRRPFPATTDGKS